MAQKAEELARSGHGLLKSNRLKILKLAIQGLDVPETDFGNISKAPHFRAFLNLAMLMMESERADLLPLIDEQIGRMIAVEQHLLLSGRLRGSSSAMICRN